AGPAHGEAGPGACTRWGVRRAPPGGPGGGGAAPQGPRALGRARPADLAATPEARHGLAQLHCHVGWLLKSAKQYSQAEVAFRKALDLQKPLADAFPASAAYRFDLARTYNGLGILLRLTGRPGQAGAAYQTA